MNPDKHTNQEFFLDVGNGHQIYVHDWGDNSAATPIIFLHGGPGSGTGDSSKSLFNPLKQRVIFSDQRGSGRSLPIGELKHNTTADLVNDLQVIVEHLKLKKIIVTGNSWGSTLALAYAIKHPSRIQSMALKGIFTGTQAENDWLDQGRFREFFPDVWRALLDQTPASYWDDVVGYHQARILGDNSEAAKSSAYALGSTQLAIVRLDDRFIPNDPIDYDPTIMKIESRYMKKAYFMPEGHILEHAPKLTMPIWIVQGRYDMMCPPINAWNLHQALPNSELVWTVSGHSGSDRGGFDVYKTLLLQLSKEA